MEARKLRGAEIAKAGGLRQRDEHLWLVPSQSHSGKWTVDYDTEDGQPVCTCPDFAERWAMCKHIFAIEIHEKRISMPTETPVKKKYTQNWPAYNAAQISEGKHFEELLYGLCQGIETPEQTGRGRPCTPLNDVVFASIMKVYQEKSGRRASSGILRCHEEGLLSKPVHHNTISLYLRKPELTPLLRKLVQESAAPLAGVETVIAIDATGVGTSTYDRYFVDKHGTKKQKSGKGMKDYVKAHAACGVRTNVCTDLVVTASKGQGTGDSSNLIPLLDGTSNHFTITEVLADKAYSTQAIHKAVGDMGAVPWIPYKANTTAKTGPKMWRKMFYYFNLHEELFAKHYHKRSNVETMFHMVKAKLGQSVRSKTPVAQANEVYLKFIAHNIICLVHAMYEMGIEPDFWQVTVPEGEVA